MTGAEALYADMGHFGKGPIRVAWSWIVFPCLVLNYAGQSAIALRGEPVADNMFYRLCPQPLLIPLVCLATVATIIASQSIITGAFSMTRQAIQLGWLPRLHINQTSEQGYGQIYVGVVNWVLMVVTIALDLAVPQVRRSRRRLRYRRFADDADDVVPAVHRHARDLAMEPVGQRRRRRPVRGRRRRIFRRKLAEDCRRRLCTAAACRRRVRGDADLASRLSRRRAPLGAGASVGPGVSRRSQGPNVPRVPGTAVFLTRTASGVPPVMRWHLRHNSALHEYVIVLSVLTDARPRVQWPERMSIVREGDGFWRVTAHYGFMQRPDIPLLLNEAQQTRMRSSAG